jgi:sodium-dependent dicarboxylate transporter 2/3/5
MLAGEKAALLAFLLAAFLWVFRQDLEFGAFGIPGWAGLMPWTWEDVLGRPLSTLPVVLAELLGPRGAESVIALAIGAGLLVVPVSRRPLRMALGLRRAGRISWGLLVLLGGGFAMAHGVARSGLSPLLAGALGSLPGLPPLLALWVVCLATIALSEVASNTATASILLPLLAAAAPNLGLHPATLMLAATLAASFGFMLPAGTPPNAVVFASGYIGVVRMARSGLAVDLGGSLLIAATSYFLVPRVLGLPH